MKAEKYYQNVIKGGLITDLVKLMGKYESEKIKISCARVLSYLVTDPHITIYQEFINAGAISALGLFH